MKTVYVLGGGVSGLTAAWSLARKGSGNIKVVVVESAAKLGGWVESIRGMNGSVHELGPRSMRFRYKAGKMALAMMSDLGLESKVIPIGPNHKAANRRLIYTEKHGLVDLPSPIMGVLRPHPPFTSQLTRSIVKEPFVKRRSRDESDESVHDFIVRRFGNEVADWLIDPMCRGIFAGSSKLLSVQSCFGILSNFERDHGSVIKGGFLSKSEPSGVEDNPLVQKGVKEKWQIYTLQGGLKTLTEALSEAAIDAGVDIRLNTSVEGIEFEGNKAKVIMDNGQEVADHVVSTLPANVAGSVLPESCSELSNSLSSIPFVSVAVVNLEYKGHVIQDQYRQAFGYLVPSHQKSNVLGVVFDSSTFPELDTTENPCTRLTVMMGGQWFEELFGDLNTVNKDYLAEAALQSLHSQLGLSSSVVPDQCIVSVLKDCIPQYTLNHGNIIGRIDDYIQSSRLPLTLLGSSYRGVSVNDCIMNSLEVSVE